MVSVLDDGERPGSSSSQVLPFGTSGTRVRGADPVPESARRHRGRCPGTRVEAPSRRWIWTVSDAEQATDVCGLAGVLQAVVGDADQSDAERDGRIPSPVDDAIEVGRASLLQD